jgi:hypothetical protein
MHAHNELYCLMNHIAGTHLVIWARSSGEPLLYMPLPPGVTCVGIVERAKMMHDFRQKGLEQEQQLKQPQMREEQTEDHHVVPQDPQQLSSHTPQLATPSTTPSTPAIETSAAVTAASSSNMCSACGAYRRQRRKRKRSRLSEVQTNSPQLDSLPPGWEVRSVQGWGAVLLCASCVSAKTTQVDTAQSQSLMVGGAIEKKAVAQATEGKGLQVISSTKKRHGSPASKDEVIPSTLSRGADQEAPISAAQLVGRRVRLYARRRCTWDICLVMQWRSKDRSHLIMRDGGSNR